MRRLTYSNFETVVVDNASSDGSAESIRRDFPGVLVLSSSTNLGFAGGCNLGILHSKGEYVLLLNNDTEIVDPNLLDVLVQVMEEDRNVAAAGPRIVEYENHNNILFDGEGDDYGFMDITGAAFLVRRGAIDRTGPLDTSFFAYYEDRDLFARLKRMGWKLRHVPSVRVAHAVSVTLTPGSPFYYYWHNRNLLIYLRRHIALRRIVFRILPRWIEGTAWSLRRMVVERDWGCLREWLRGYLDGMKMIVREEVGRIPRQPFEPDKVASVWTTLNAKTDQDVQEGTRRV